MVWGIFGVFLLGQICVTTELKGNALQGIYLIVIGWVWSTNSYDVLRQIIEV